MVEPDALIVAWRNGEIPDLDGVVFRDGTYVPMDSYSIEGNHYGISGMRRLNPENCDLDLQAVGDLSWEGRVDNCSYNVKDRPLTIVAGECTGHGSIGYIASVDTSCDEPVWILFCSDSNPFDCVEVKDGVILAHTTAYDIWTIDLEDPTSVSITHCPYRMWSEFGFEATAKMRENRVDE